MTLPVPLFLPGTDRYTVPVVPTAQADVYVALGLEPLQDLHHPSHQEQGSSTRQHSDAKRQQRFLLCGVERDQAAQSEKGHGGDQRSKGQDADKPRLTLVVLVVVMAALVVANIVVVIEIVVSHSK